MEMIRMIEVAPLEAPRLIETEHTLENLQELVGGTVQAVYPWDEDLVAVLCDDDGKFKGYPANRALVDENGDPYDIVAGSFFICGISEDDFSSLTDEQADRFSELFRWPEVFFETSDKHIMCMKLKEGETPSRIA